MRQPLARPLLVLSALLACGPSTASRAQDKDRDKPQSPVEVHEWSIWVGNPAQTALNASRVYRNAMPSVIGTARPKVEDKDLDKKFPIAPVSVVQFFGEPCRDIDVDLRLKEGTFLAHWPPGAERGNRLQWFKSGLGARPPDNIPPSYLPPTHWFQALRDGKDALFLKHESNFDRFLAYDSELPLPIPLRLRGGPDEYSLQNLTGRRLLDVAVIAPTGDGFRVGWLDELPTAVPEKEKDKPSAKGADGKGGKKKDEKTAEQKAEAVFVEAEKAKDKDQEKDEELPPLPAEGDANVRARVDQLLNRPIVVAVEKAPRRDVLALVAGQARVPYELDDRALAKAEVKLDRPMDLKVSGVSGRDALADVLGEVGLSYRVTESGKLFVTTAARLADDTGKKGRVVEGPPVKLLMSQPLKASDTSYREMTRDALARRLAGQGLREDVARTLLDQYGRALFEPGELVVLAHLSRDAIDEAVLLDVFPPPKTLVRTALVVVHGVDPRLQDRARALVRELGDEAPKVRESAEARLLELGPVVVPVLEDALTDKDIEVVFRAERLLLRLNRPVP